MLKQLTNTIQMPMVGFGTYLIEDKDAESVVAQAIQTGYRHVDTAEAYQNEAGVGKGIKAAMAQQALSRDDLFVTTKLWPGNPEWGDAPKTAKTTVESLNQSLAKLQLDHVDLYLIHVPIAPEQRIDQWRGLVELREQGKARAIGVSNYSQAHIEEIKAAGLPLPDANQIELHPWSQKSALIAYLAEHDITPIAYSSLVPLSTWRAVEGQDSAKTDQMVADGGDGSSFKTMATKYGVSEAQVLLRWGVQKGYSVLPKSTNPERMANNMDLFSFSIDDEDMAAIEKMDRGDGVAWQIGDPTRLT